MTALIIMALVVAVLVFLVWLGSREDGKQKNEWAAGVTPQDLRWDVLLSAEIQVCLPDKKIEAIKRYREQTGVGLKEAKDAVEYAMAHPQMAGQTGSQPHAKGREMGLNWDVLLLPEIQDALPDRKIEAIKLYRQYTGVGLKEAKDAIDYFSEHRSDVPAKLRRYDLVDEQAEGIRDLLREGKRAEAQKIYQAFTGVDQFTASEALDALEHAIATEVERYERRLSQPDES